MLDSSSREAVGHWLGILLDDFSKGRKSKMSSPLWTLLYITFTLERNGGNAYMNNAFQMAAI